GAGPPSTGVPLPGPESGLALPGLALPPPEPSPSVGPSAPAVPVSPGAASAAPSASVGLSPSALGEGVADTTDRLDEGGVGGVILDLVAQVAHVDVDCLLVLV